MAAFCTCRLFLARDLRVRAYRRVERAKRANHVLHVPPGTLRARYVHVLSINGAVIERDGE